MAGNRDARERTKTILSTVSMLINVVLTLLKGVVGVISGSDALLADAAHSASDVAGSIAVFVGLRVARRPPDEAHPYGHGKAEFIAASLVAILLILAGLEVVYNSFREFFSHLTPPGVMAMYTAGFSALVKEVIYRYQIGIGRKIQSPALIAGAADHRSDVYSSLAATAGIGIALLGGATRQPYLLYADPVAGLVVAIVVVRMGYKLAIESFTSLMDQVMDADTTQEIAQHLSEIKGVLRVDDMRVRGAGSYWVVDVKVSVDPQISVLSGHAIARQVKEELLQEFTEIHDVLVHINPFFDAGDE